MSEAEATRAETVDIRGVDGGIAIGSEVAVAEIVRDDQDNVERCGGDMLEGRGGDMFGGWGLVVGGAPGE